MVAAEVLLAAPLIAAIPGLARILGPIRTPCIVGAKDLTSFLEWHILVD